jgi:hypothetical protein
MSPFSSTDSRKGLRLMVSASRILQLHDELTRAWHVTNASEGAVPPLVQAANGHRTLMTEWMERVADEHRANFDLWHIEDEAREPGASDTTLAHVKRRIDRTNQLRNDLAEALDCALMEWLAPRGLPRPDAPLHSESPGLMIDRLSIQALKIYHTREEAERGNAPQGHAERNHERLAILEEQRKDLARCLDSLWQETLSGARRFKLYRQLKMYNDPHLNPVIYRKAGSGGEG